MRSVAHAAERLGRDLVAVQPLERALDVAGPVRALHGTVGVARDGVEEVRLLTVHVEAQQRAVGIEHVVERRGQRRRKGAVCTQQVCRSATVRVRAHARARQRTEATGLVRILALGQINLPATARRLLERVAEAKFALWAVASTAQVGV